MNEDRKEFLEKHIIGEKICEYVQEHRMGSGSNDTCLNHIYICGLGEIYVNKDGKAVEPNDFVERACTKEFADICPSRKIFHSINPINGK